MIDRPGRERRHRVARSPVAPRAVVPCSPEACRWPSWSAIGHLLLITLALACADAEPQPDPQSESSPAEPETLWIEIAGQSFELELAIDPQIRFRGLGGRTSIARNGGMLFVNRASEPQAMVMRDCPIPIDIAFLDAGGRVVAIHAMLPEPPRRPDESRQEYETRLPQYWSGAPALFAVEMAGGRISELGLRVGERLVFDVAGLLKRERRGAR